MYQYTIYSRHNSNNFQSDFYGIMSKKITSGSCIYSSEDGCKNVSAQLSRLGYITKIRKDNSGKFCVDII